MILYSKIWKVNVYAKGYTSILRRGGQKNAAISIASQVVRLSFIPNFNRINSKTFFTKNILKLFFYKNFI